MEYSKETEICPYEPVEPEDSDNITNLIYQELSDETIQEIEEMLINPTPDAIHSLIWIPERLKKYHNENSRL